MAPRTVVEHSKVSRALNVKNSEIEDCGSVEKLKKHGFFCKKKLMTGRNKNIRIHDIMGRRSEVHTSCLVIDKCSILYFIKCVLLVTTSYLTFRLDRLCKGNVALLHGVLQPIVFLQ